MAVETVRVKNTGLRGVAVADTKVSYIDGEHGVLIYRGYRIEELAERSTFMETVFLLLNSHLPSEAELERFERQFVLSRDVPGFILEGLEKFPV
jgi:citrate synthase